MARRGYKAPRNYDPRRSSKHKGKAQPGQHRAASPATATAQQHTAGRDHTLPALPSPLPAPLAATRTPAHQHSNRSWAELGLGGNIVRTLTELGAPTPFAIQSATIPDVLAGHHLLARSRTGSGKTIAFAAALVERLLQLQAQGVFPAPHAREPLTRGTPHGRQKREPSRAPKALILAPTRELALQIDDTVQPIARSVGLYTGQFVGGQPFEPQLHALQRGIDIVIGTPGRVADLAARGQLPLSTIAVTVIDEADHMAELGFLEQLRQILRQTRRGGQRLLFSATLDHGVSELVEEYMPRPAIHEVVEGAAPPANAAAAETQQHGGYAPPENVTHRVLVVMREHKNTALVQLARAAGRTVVFCRTRGYVEHVTQLLRDAGLQVVPLHGELAQAKRERNLARFTTGKAEVLVATDIAARGIHVDDIALVLQADPPDDPKSYVHRAGRTGRVGKAGQVVTVIYRTSQQRTRALFSILGFEPEFFGEFVPENAPPLQARGAHCEKHTR